MTGKTHLALGATASLTLTTNLPIKSKALILAFSLISSLIPDLDHPKAKLNQKILLFQNGFSKFILYFTLGCISIYFHFISDNEIFLPLGIVLILLGYSSHRTFTHSFLGLFLASIVVKIISEKYLLNEIYYGFLIGYITHLIADFFNPRGLQIFYPLKKRFSAPITIKTGGKLENKIFIISTIYSLFLLFVNFEIFKI
ncbi:metal-dependent hydrolase [Peptoniphilus stercorisuis]|uniref:Inner membrane protein n=1 Tax=Peptoniphilus stercorisuis TaxID=1436965 RepID=A0ABS4KDG5_9FIRM|nr:metal-dependent hydrolase [Peptoniphilus stercorisuis]MBP2025805.1 inner membrane protein [Peptoniphilus stercorisuis]